MLLQNIKIYAVKKLLPPTISLAAIIFILGFELLIQNSMQDNLNSIKNQGEEIRKQAHDIEADIEAFNDNAELWREISSAKKEFKGLQISIAERIINQLRTKFNIFNFQINLSIPAMRQTYNDNKYASVEYSEVKMNFSSYSDVEIFNFLESLTKLIPGFLQITDLQIDAATINKQFLQSSTIETRQEIVKCRVSLLWQDIREKKDETAS